MTSYPHTNGNWDIYIDANFLPDMKLASFYERMKVLQQNVSKLPNYLGSYVNDYSCLIKNEKIYFAQNTDKLQEIKAKYDPENRFHRPPCKL